MLVDRIVFGNQNPLQECVAALKLRCWWRGYELRLLRVHAGSPPALAALPVELRRLASGAYRSILRLGRDLGCHWLSRFHAPHPPCWAFRDIQDCPSGDEPVPATTQGPPVPSHRSAAWPAPDTPA